MTRHPDFHFPSLLLGDEYSNGEEFCRGQKFKVVDATTKCFAFDPNVFGTAATFNKCHIATIILSSLFLFHYKS